MHATPKSAIASSVAVDLAKDVFELAFADADAHIHERRAWAFALSERIGHNKAAIALDVPPL